MVSSQRAPEALVGSDNRGGGETKCEAGISTAAHIIHQALAAALDLAESGIPVFPCILDGTKRDKSPATPHGFKDASCDPAAVRNLWCNYPGALVGVPTGGISGIDVLDIDPRHGGDKWLEAIRDRLPATRTHATRSGGYHLLFRHRSGMGCSASRIARGVDVRADGGYACWWPAAGLPVVDNSPVARWPSWLEPQALPPAPKPLPRPVIELTGTRLQRYALTALKNGANRVMNAGEGARNSTLNAEAWGIFRHFSGVIGPQKIADAMAAAALSAGLDHKETAATIASAMRAGGVE